MAVGSRSDEEGEKSRMTPRFLVVLIVGGGYRDRGGEVEQGWKETGQGMQITCAVLALSP